MIEGRIDLSAWVMHFVHRKNPAFDPAAELNEGESVPLFPFIADRQKNRRFDFWNMVEESHHLAGDEYAFYVLMKMLEDGHIRSGWSFRGKAKLKPTIYGPRSACCFTEMPLYALLDYAKRRSPSDVGSYAICLRRDELFAAGGRPVIYGLSGDHREKPRPKLGRAIYDDWPRILDPSCGISEDEQYRYVSMSLGGDREIDWGHEREWRWADGMDVCSCPGLPIWLDDEPITFSRIAVVVSTNKEASTVLNKLKELFDAGAHNFGYSYKRESLRATEVISLEEVLATVKEERFATVRLDELPATTIQVFNTPAVTHEYRAKVRVVLKKASKAAIKAANNYEKKALAGKAGYSLDGFGFAHLVLRSSQSPLVTALQELDEITVFGGAGYWISNFGGGGQLAVALASVKAAQRIFSKHFPDDEFEISSRWD
ncbi:hypothetical protein [Rhizobium leguminosarum]|uniref:hypothetical protein n=1 Tax=Rhizobium leguminosarum TaxID=384 RepID=UPI003F99A6F6